MSAFPFASFRERFFRQHAAAATRAKRKNATIISFTIDAPLEDVQKLRFKEKRDSTMIGYINVTHIHQKSIRIACPRNAR